MFTALLLIAMLGCAYSGYTELRKNTRKSLMLGVADLLLAFLFAYLLTKIV